MRLAEIHPNKLTDWMWEVPKTGEMRVPTRIYASEKLMANIRHDDSLVQAVNVAYMPGIVKYSLAMPDIHLGYGFPIGGVAAFTIDEGVISPGGIGYDINCGVRLIRSDLAREEVQDRLQDLANQIYRDVPAGVGSHEAIQKLGRSEMEKATTRGAEWAVSRGYGSKEDLDHTENRGCLEAADFSRVSDYAVKRGSDQMGTLGSGNHFLEIDEIAEVLDPQAAEAFGLKKGFIAFQVHCGSRGFGHQICTDYIKTMQRAMDRYGIRVPDRQLCCAPITSDEGKQYFAAMACGANFAWANRQTIMHLAIKAFERVLGRTRDDMGLRLVYDVAHNIAKFETHQVDGSQAKVCVHRKGATRAFPPGHPDTPEVYRSIGQPVLIPGDMGRQSFVLVGTQAGMETTFGSTCHGAGRAKSRSASAREVDGADVARDLAARGIIVRAKGRKTLVEEVSEAYKDVADVVDVVHQAGIARKVARLVPLAVVKG